MQKENLAKWGSLFRFGKSGNVSCYTAWNNREKGGLC